MALIVRLARAVHDPGWDRNGVAERVWVTQWWHAGRGQREIAFDDRLQARDVARGHHLYGSLEEGLDQIEEGQT
jgi:hypothetical protein